MHVTYTIDAAYIEFQLRPEACSDTCVDKIGNNRWRLKTNVLFKSPLGDTSI